MGSTEQHQPALLEHYGQAGDFFFDFGPGNTIGGGKKGGGAKASKGTKVPKSYSQVPAEHLRRCMISPKQ